jgi:hypothetical protein
VLVAFEWIDFIVRILNRMKIVANDSGERRVSSKDVCPKRDSTFDNRVFGLKELEYSEQTFRRSL